jgi:hypothetical protein
MTARRDVARIEFEEDGEIGEQSSHAFAIRFVTTTCLRVRRGFFASAAGIVVCQTISKIRSRIKRVSAK